MIKRINLAIISTAMLGAYLLVSAQQKPFSNGGFETGNLQSWFTWDKEHNKANIIDNVKNIHSGKFAVELSGGVLFQDFFLKKGSKVDISMFTKYNWGKTSVVEVYHITGVNNNQTLVTTLPISTKLGYQESNLSFEAQHPGRYRLIFSVGKGGGKYLIDDVIVNCEL